MSKSRIGEINYNKYGSKMKIVAYRNAKDIDVYFEEYDWVFKNGRYGHFKDGNMRCPYDKSICGVGYIGEGKYKVWENGKHTKEYDIWNDMIKRCYTNTKINIAYKDCEVCEEWHNFQNFAEWYEENYYEIKEEKTQLDKDILIHGNNIYSPQTCIFVPSRINALFIKRKRKRGDYPIGISYHKRDNILEVWCRTIEEDSKGNYLGRFKPNQVEEAFQCYKTFKENYIKQVADDYYSKGLIPKKLYDAMYRYEVEITD